MCVWGGGVSVGWGWRYMVTTAMVRMYIVLNEHGLPEDTSKVDVQTIVLLRLPSSSSTPLSGSYGNV